MKASQILAILSFSAISMAQTLAPSPTESTGCEPHGDHWHCEAARSTTGAVSGTTLSTAVAATTSAEDHDHDHDDDDDHSSGATSYTLPPSPTGRGACSAHGDHWHCDIAASKTSAESGASTDAVESTAASATAATTTGAAATSASGSAEASTTAVPAGAARAGFGAAAIVAALMAF